MHTARYQPVGKATGRKSFALLISYCKIFNQAERDPNALGARRRELPRRDHFRDSNDVDFTKDIAKSFADQCKSRLTNEMSNATLFKHLERRK